MSVWNLLIASTLAVLVVSGPASVFAQPSSADSRQQVDRALSELNEWLDVSPGGQGWKDYLLLGDLRAELTKGDDADLAALRRVLAKFASGQPGLDRPRFVATAGALRQWLNQLAAGRPSELPQMLLDAQGTYAPVSDARLSAARRRLQASVDMLEQQLSRWGAAGRGWRTYLEFDALQRELAAGNDADAEQLRRLAQRFGSGNVGLELPVFAGVGQPLRAYQRLLASRQNAEAAGQFDADLKLLADELPRYAASPSPQLAQQLGSVVGRLAGAGQVPDLVAAVRGQLAQPNLVVRIAEPIVAAGMNDQIDNTSDIRDVVLGANVRGTARMIGEVESSLVPSAEEAVIDLIVRGIVHSSTVASSGPARVSNRGRTGISARKRLLLDDDGFRSLRAVSRAVADNTITGISVSGGPIVQNQARQRIYGNQAAGEREAARKAQARLNQRLDEQAAEMLGKANRQYETELKFPLQRYNAYPQDVRVSTTDDHLNILVLAADSQQVAAPAAPPQWSEGQEMEARIHQSVVDNIAGKTYAGRTITDAEFKQLIDKSKKKPAADGAPTEETPPADEDPEEAERRQRRSITFADENPVSVQVDEEGFSVVMRAKRFVTGSGVVNEENVEIRAKYRFEQGENGPIATRSEDELEIVFVDAGNSLTTQQRTMRRRLRDRFSETFKEKLEPEPLTLPGKWERAGPLQLTEWRGDRQGWMSLGWQR